jgi:hypothetical protein
MTPVIRLIIHVYSSERDVNGNCYHSASVTDTETGASARFRNIGGASNMDGIGQLLGIPYGYPCVYTVREQLPKRRYQRLTKYWAYIANHANQAAADALRAAIEAARKGQA